MLRDKTGINGMAVGPSQIDIENSLSIALLKLRQQKTNNVLIEDEGGGIGSRRIPDNLFNRMKQSPLIILEASIEERVENIFNEYILNALAEYQQAFGEIEGFKLWAENLQNSLDKIQKRLGGLRHKELKSVMDAAIIAQQQQNDPAQHRRWIRNLLIEYYDPMYDYQLAGKKDRLVFRGDQQSVQAFLLNKYGFESIAA